MDTVSKAGDHGDAIEARLQLISENSFSHVPYYKMQQHAFETDGGFAARYEIDCSCRHDSRFAEEAGAAILDLIAGEVGIDVLEERQMQLYPGAGDRDDGWRLPRNPSDADFEEYGRRTAVYTLGKIAAVFPEVGMEKLERFSGDVARFAARYGREVHEFYWKGVPMDDGVASRSGHESVRAAVRSGDVDIVLLAPGNDVQKDMWVLVTEGRNAAEGRDSDGGNIREFKEMEDALSAFDEKSEACSPSPRM